MKNREHHYENNCNYFKFYECHAHICKIKSNKTCTCLHCKHHDCYELNQHNFDEFDDKGNAINQKSISKEEERELLDAQQQSAKLTTKNGHCIPCPECKDKPCEVKHKCGAKFGDPKCKDNAGCEHPCGVRNGFEDCKTKPCGRLHVCC